MTTKIYKYPIQLATTTLTLPLGAKILHVGFQQKELYIWAEVDPDAEFDAEFEKRQFYVAATGAIITHENKVHLATVFTGPFVLHVFELITRGK